MQNTPYIDPSFGLKIGPKLDVWGSQIGWSIFMNREQQNEVENGATSFSHTLDLDPRVYSLQLNIIFTLNQ